MTGPTTGPGRESDPQDKDVTREDWTAGEKGGRRRRGGKRRVDAGGSEADDVMKGRE